MRGDRIEGALLIGCGGLLAAWAVGAVFGHASLHLLVAAGVAALAYLCVSQLRMLFSFPRRGQGAAGTAGLVGARGRVVEPLRPEGRVRVGAEVWRARAEVPVEAGASVVVREVRGLELIVEPR